MTDFNKIVSYYDKFDEWSRLENPEGKLEFVITMGIIEKYLPANSKVFDLGGGPGRYTAMLSNLGHKMSLADLSPTLINLAHDKIRQIGTQENISQIDVCNALDLSKYSDDSFDAVLLFGPLYHLTSEIEILKCLSEVSRVIKKEGILFAVYIPWIAGFSGVLERAFYAPVQVNADRLVKTYNDGIFNNGSSDGFQEGAYIKTDKMLDHFSKAGFNKILLRSIRGLGCKLEKNILLLQESDPEYHKTIIDIINKTATESAVIETCGHAIFVGEKI